MMRISRRELLCGTAMSAAGTALTGMFATGDTTYPEPTTISTSERQQEATVSSKHPFEYVIGIVGNPSSPEIEWSDEQLSRIKELGVNMLQLSIAWGGKPANEVINLEDLDAEQRAKFAFRIEQAKKHGFRTLAHFGVPRMLNFAPVRPACILEDSVRKHYADLLTDFLRSFPDVHDILIYTYDQQAWICSEYGPCPRCSGLPLHDRLPGFMNHLKDTMQRVQPGSRLWWKPWELTKGQTQNIVERMDPEHFGLMLNPSTSNEVYPFNDRSFKSDLGVKRLVRMAADRNIPVVGEYDHTLYKGLYQIADYFPRIVHEQLQAWAEMEGVVGIKEYYGFAPSQFSVNAAMLKACMQSFDAPLDQLLAEVAAPYGEKAAPIMIAAWETVAQGAEAFPWDTTYLIGPMGLERGNDGSHGWEPVTIPNSAWDTPIWQCNRRGNFMLTQDHKAHPWLFEDAGLRLEDSAALHFKAARLFDEAIAAGSPKADDIQMQRDFVWNTGRALRGTSLHFLETLTAQSARMVQGDASKFGRVAALLEDLLVRDVDNQGGAAPVAEKLAAFGADPKAWLTANLNPRTYESICTVDWSKWVPTA